jgi:hypothetical protein
MKKNYLLVLISLGLCSGLLLSINLAGRAAPAAAVVSPSRVGKLTAIDVAFPDNFTRFC